MNETEWENSHKNGRSLTYTQGELFKVEHYKDNELHGKVIQFDSEGNKETLKYRKGELVVRTPKKNKIRKFFQRNFEKVFRPKDMDEPIPAAETSAELQE
ncbi:hypothetical protein [Geofilum rubicundum]|uniref:hypothetical protein n=1 Tax=Geofilum rubicundum TaxID=472113 RepID=UPI0012FCB235|nr:hypothetical protein [Geofilum rubicundum]